MESSCLALEDLSLSDMLNLEGGGSASKYTLVPVYIVKIKMTLMCIK